MSGGPPSTALAPDVEALLARLNAAFPALGTEVTDAAEARRLFERLRRPPQRPTPVGGVADLEIPGPGGEPLPLRRYEPAPGAAVPGAAPVLFMHGGGWVLGGLDSHDELVRRLVAGSGLTIVAVDYRLAPEHPFPAALDDAFAALCHLAAGGSPVVVAGDSAGGGLAAALAMLARDRGGPPVSGQLLLYPMLDSRADSASYRENGSGFYITAEHLRWFWRQYLPDPGRAADPYASPAHGELHGLPPAAIVVPDLDPLRDDALGFAAALAAAGGEVEVSRHRGAFHGFLAFADRLDLADAALETTCGALRELAERGR